VPLLQQRTRDLLAIAGFLSLANAKVTSARQQFGYNGL